MLITGRLIPDLGAAFLVPSSLGLINTVFDKADQSAAIGVWTGWTGTAVALGPLLGGVCVDFLGWRWIFVLSAVPMAVAYSLTFWLCPMSTRVEGARVDTVGVGFSTVGLAATVYALVESQRNGLTDPMVITPLVIGIAALAGFVSWQHRITRPMLPLPLFTFRNFVAANVVTRLLSGGVTWDRAPSPSAARAIRQHGDAARLATLPHPGVSSYSLVMSVAWQRPGPRAS